MRAPPPPTISSTGCLIPAPTLPTDSAPLAHLLPCLLPASTGILSPLPPAGESATIGRDVKARVLLSPDRGAPLLHGVSPSPANTGSMWSPQPPSSMGSVRSPLPPAGSSEIPQAPLSRSMSFKVQMEEEGINLHELFDVDSVSEEKAEVLIFDATQNSWASSEVVVKVAARMFAHGNNFGCIRMRDLTDGRVKVLKKSLSGAPDDDLYDDVKAHALGELCCKLFRQTAPQIDMGFMPRVIYKLVQRSNRPKIMCEELLTESDDFAKRELSLFPPRNATPEDVYESHKWAVFQFFTFLQSQRGMVFDKCDLVHGIWMNPIIHSNDQTLGGHKDGGPEAVERWANDFAERYSKLFDLPGEELMTLDIDQLLKVMEHFGCLRLGGEATNPAPRSMDTAVRPPPQPSGEGFGPDVSIDRKLYTAPDINTVHVEPKDPNRSRGLSTGESFPIASFGDGHGEQSLQRNLPDSFQSMASPTLSRAESPGSGKGTPKRQPSPQKPHFTAAAKPIDMVIKLGLDYSAAGQEGSPQRVAFTNNFIQDLSNASGLPPDCFEVTQLMPGSVIIYTVIHPDTADTNPLAVASDLEKQASDPNSVLRSGVLTRHTQDIALPILRPGSLDQMLGGEHAGPNKSTMSWPSERSRSPGMPLAPAMNSPQKMSRDEADDAQLAALKAKLNRYQRELGASASRQTAPQPTFQPPAVEYHSALPAPVTPRQTSQCAPVASGQSPAVRTTPTARARSLMLSPPIATLLEESVEPASSLLKMDADKAAAQSFHNAGKGRNGGTNHDYLATEGRHQGLLALDVSPALSAAVGAPAAVNYLPERRVAQHSPSARQPSAPAYNISANANTHNRVSPPARASTPVQDSATSSASRRRTYIDRPPSAPQESKHQMFANAAASLAKPYKAPTVNWGFYQSQVME